MTVQTGQRTDKKLYMKKLLFILLTLFWINSYSQNSDTTYKTVLHGDSLWNVWVVNSFSIDSVYRKEYQYNDQCDSVLVSDTMRWVCITVITDSIEYYYKYRTFTGSVKDSVRVPTKLKTVGSNDIKGIGDIPITVNSVDWTSIINEPSFVTTSEAASTYQPIGSYAASSHNHNGIYEPANSNIQAHIASNANPHGVTKAQVSLSNVDNTSDANKPVSTATQTALNAKQATLVSGTNIKTVNGNSLLGSGDVVISGGGGNDWVYVKLVSAATTTGTANSNTLLAFTPIANTMYEFEAKLFLQSAATTTGVRPGIAWPSGLTQNSAWVLSPTSQTAFASRFFGNTSTANAASTATAIINEGFYGKAEGMFVTGANPSGNLIITLASEIAASEVRIMQNSFIRYRIIE